MPNHITNILNIKGNQQEVEKCLQSIKGTEKDEEGSYERLIDFNKIIPRPKSLDITSGSKVDNAIAILKDDEKYFNGMLDYPWVKQEGLTTTEQIKEHLKGSLSPQDFEEGKTAIENIQKYGCKDWYSWSIQYWGTKWNAYDQIEVGFGTIQFDTAWSTPFPVVQKLAAMFPELDFEVKFADEDLGNNCGSYQFENGQIVGEYQPEGAEAMKFACEVKGYEFNQMIADNFEYWDLDNLKGYEESIVEMLQEGWVTELTDAADRDENEGKEKIEYIKQLAIDNELYEVAAEIDKQRSHE